MWRIATQINVSKYSKLGQVGLRIEHNLEICNFFRKAPITQILMICHLLPFAKSGQKIPGIASQFAMHFYILKIYSRYLLCTCICIHVAVSFIEVYRILFEIFVCWLNLLINQIWRGKLFPAGQHYCIKQGSWTHVCERVGYMCLFSHMYETVEKTYIGHQNSSCHMLWMVQCIKLFNNYVHT